jgi:hypothetical protein
MLVMIHHLERGCTMNLDEQGVRENDRLVVTVMKNGVVDLSRYISSG